MTKRYISATELVSSLEDWECPSETRVWGIPRGGSVVAALLAAAGKARLADTPERAEVLVDDIYDSGQTAKKYQTLYNLPVWCAFDKRMGPWKGEWLVMPWEGSPLGPTTDGGEDIVTRLLQYIGEDPTREGLQDTPRRFLEAWAEFSRGYAMDPAAILGRQFSNEGMDELVVVRNISFHSKCEHHLADMNGVVNIGYIPGKTIVGLSKMARLVEAYSRRLQVQERLTNQLADAMNEHLRPLGVGIIVRASHACMASRGVRAHNTDTVTSALRGVMKTKPEARAEFLALCNENISRW